MLSAFIVSAAASPIAPAGDCGPGPAAAGTGTITVNFANLNPAGPMDASNTWVTFGGGTAALVGTINGSGKALKLGKSYPMSDLAQGVTLSNYNSGRICISYGAGLTADASNCWSPNFNNPALDDYGTRWDKVEITWNGVAGGANLTAQDFFGIPMQLQSSGGGQPATTLTWWKSTSEVMNALGAMCGYSLNSEGVPTGALVEGTNGVSIAGLPGTQIIRVINPSTVTAGTGGSTGYPSFQTYLETLRNDGGAPVVTTISGGNGVFNGAVQSYSFSVYVVNAWDRLYGTVVRVGDLVFDGRVANGSKNVPTTFVIRRENLTDSAIYGANAAFSMIRGSNLNSIVQKARADYLSALNFGFAGSTVANPMRPRDTIGDSPSWTWYGNKPNGVNQTAMPISYAFGTAQPSHPYFNPVAAYLTTVTDAYGFAFNDRLQAPLAPLGPGSTVTITVLTDAGGSSIRKSAPGAMDLVVQNALTGEVEAWNMDDFRLDGRYRPAVAGLAGMRVVAAADWDGDGTTDLLSHAPKNGRLVVTRFYNGHPFDSTALTPLAKGPAWRVAGMGDMDGDGLCDVVWTRPDDGIAEVWSMDGFVRLAAITPSGQAWRAAGAVPVAVADWNADGVAELVAWHGPSGTLSAYRLAGTRFVPMAQVVMPAPLRSAAWRVVAVRDMDGDGDLDVVFQRGSGGALKVAVLDGSGALEVVHDVAIPSGYPNGPMWFVRNAG
jgi:hypothetical protein